MVIPRKTRVRRHIIADLSLHHVAYQIVKAGFTIEAVRADYGYDGTMVTYDQDGNVENGNIFMQLKATDHLERYKGPRRFSYPVGKKDVDLWGGEPFPVYLILFDTASEIAYWAHLQNFLQLNNITAATMTTDSVRVDFDPGRIVDIASIHAWRDKKAEIIRHIGPVSHV